MGDISLGLEKNSFKNLNIIEGGCTVSFEEKTSYAKAIYLEIRVNVRSISPLEV